MSTSVKEVTTLKVELGVTIKEKELAKYEAFGSVETFKKSDDFTRATKNHCITKLIKFYGDLVKQIKEVQPEVLVDQVKGLCAFLVSQQ